MSDAFDPGDIAWVRTRQDFDHLLHAISEAEEVTLDLETSGLNEHREGASIVLAQFTVPHGVGATHWLLPLDHSESPFADDWQAAITEAAQTLHSARTALVGHNLKFDLRWLHAHTGTDLSHLLAWDTMSAAHLLDETKSTKLKEVAPRTFGVERWDDFDLSKPGAALNVPMDELGLYGARDTYWTHRLAEQQRGRMFLRDEYEQPVTEDEIEDARLGRLAVWCAVPTAATLTAIEQRGIGVDIPWIDATLDDHRTRIRELRARLGSLHPDMEGDPNFAPTSHWFRAWTSRCVDAGSLEVVALTPTGRPQWNKEVLTKLSRKGHAVAQDLLDLRGYMKRSEYLHAWKHFAVDGSIHATYHTGSVVTGRLSSSGPNMQQVTKSMRPAFVPRPGKLLADLDYCLEGSMRILTSDLRWVPADQIQVGEKIIGFPEQFGRGHGYSHQYEESEITSVKQLTRPSVILVMSDGQHIKCSREHRWMRGGKSKTREWVQAGDLQPGDVIPTLTDPWNEPASVQEVEDRAYLRGILDGEGWVNETTVGWGQLPGNVYDEVQAVSERLGLDWRVNSFMNNGVVQQRVSNVRDSLRILGMVRPVRLLPKARQMWEGRNTWGKSKTGAMVMEVIDAGEQPVWAIGTSTKTMVVEGLLSHNSQIELRVAAHISGCQPMIDAFNRGDDLHRLLAARITGKKPEDVTADERQKGKSANFGLLYGMGAFGFRAYSEAVYGVEMTKTEAHAVHRAFFDTWEGMREWHARAARVAHNTGQIVSPIGRVRRLPGIFSADPDRWGGDERAAINSPVQGMASDIMQIASSRIEGTAPDTDGVPGADIVATVHDSIVVEVPADDWRAVVSACIAEMTFGVLNTLRRLDCELTVPLDVGFSVGTRWGLDDVV